MVLLIDTANMLVDEDAIEAYDEVLVPAGTIDDDTAEAISELLNGFRRKAATSYAQ
jgi:hypothetical protein